MYTPGKSLFAVLTQQCSIKYMNVNKMKDTGWILSNKCVYISVQRKCEKPGYYKNKSIKYHCKKSIKSGFVLFGSKGNIRTETLIALHNSIFQKTAQEIPLTYFLKAKQKKENAKTHTIHIVA